MVSLFVLDVLSSTYTHCLSAHSLRMRCYTFFFFYTNRSSNMDQKNTHNCKQTSGLCVHTHSFWYDPRLSQDPDDIVLVIRERFKRRVIREWLCSSKPVWPVLHFDIKRTPTVWPPLWKHTDTHFLCELYLGNKVAYKLTGVWEISDFVAWIFPFLWDFYVFLIIYFNLSSRTFLTLRYWRKIQMKVGRLS